MARSRSTSVQVMVCCLTAPSNYLNQSWLIISKVHSDSFGGNFIGDTIAISKKNKLEYHLSNILFRSHRDQWVHWNFNKVLTISMWSSLSKCTSISVGWSASGRAATWVSGRADTRAKRATGIADTGATGKVATRAPGMTAAGRAATGSTGGATTGPGGWRQWRLLWIVRAHSSHCIA